MHHQCYVTTDSIRAEVRMPSAVADLQRARQERLKRFAAAAAKISPPEIVHEIVPLIAMAEPVVEAPLVCYPVIPNPTTEQAKRLLVSEIQRAVVRNFGTPLEEMVSERRDQFLVLPRQVAMYLTRKRTSLGTKTIGRFFGNRDHSTVIHGVNRVRELMAFDPVLRARIEFIDAGLAE